MSFKLPVLVEKSHGIAVRGLAVIPDYGNRTVKVETKRIAVRAARGINGSHLLAVEKISVPDVTRILVLADDHACVVDSTGNGL